MGRLKKGQNKNCVLCGGIFYALRSEERRGGAKYCSKECYFKGRIRKIENECFICHKTFLTKPSIVKIGKGIVCSPICSSKKISFDRKGNQPSWLSRKGLVPWNKNKKGLQKAWNKGIRGIIKATRGSFRKGMIPWNKGKKFLAGPLNPNWHGGIGRLPYPFKFNKELKEKIRDRDFYECKNCGMTEEEHLIVYGRVLIIHHIDYIKTNCSEYNLMAVCLPCNFRFNYNREYWKNLFQEKINQS